MDFYIDLSVLVAVLFSFTCLNSVKILTFVKFNKVYEIIFILLNGFIPFLIYIPMIFSYIVFFVFIIGSFLILNKNKNISSVILYLLLYFSIGLILNHLGRGITFVNVSLIITSKEGILISLLIPLFGLMMILSSIFVDKVYHLKNYKERILLKIGEKEYELSSYYDTGNVMKFQNSPVIFLSNKIIDIDSKEFKYHTYIQTIASKQEVALCEGLISKKNSDTSYFVYVAFVENSKSFQGCDVLLNAYLF